MLCLLKMQLLEAICWIAAGLWKLSSASTHRGGPRPHHTQDHPPRNMGSPREACRIQSFVWGHHCTSSTISYKKMHLVHNIFGLRHSRHPRIWCYYSVIGWRHLHRATQSILLPGAEQFWTHHSGDTTSFKNLEWRKRMKSRTVAHSCPGWLCGSYTFFMLCFGRWWTFFGISATKPQEKSLGFSFQDLSNFISMLSFCCYYKKTPLHLCSRQSRHTLEVC